MALYYIVLLALVQGVTEFLPISSSGHLALFHAFTDTETGQEIFRNNLLIDVAVHVGTLFSVLLYFRSDLCAMIRPIFCKPIALSQKTANGRKLGLHILIASLPVIVAGFALHHFQFFWGHAIELIAWTTLIFGILLWVMDAYKPAVKVIEEMTPIHALFIGIAQVLALIPGTSRSGITMTAARFLGYTRTEAARFSLLLAIVAIAGAGTLGVFTLIELGDLEFSLNALIAVVLSFVSGLIAIHLMMKWLEHASFKVFAIYRIILGLALLALVYSGTF